MKKILIYLAIIFLVIYLFSCNEQPTDIGKSLITDSVTVNAISSDTAGLITNYRSYWQNSPTFNSGGILVGNASETKAVSLLRYQDIPDSLDHLEESDFVSVKLRLYPGHYQFGENRANLAFDVKKVTKVWKRDSTFYDHLMVSPADYIEPAVLSNYSGSIDISSDNLDPVEIDLPASLMTEWFQTKITPGDTTNDGEIIYDTSAVVNYGIALLPNGSGTFIQRFKALGRNTENFSQIIAVFKNEQNENDTIVMNAAIEASYCDAPKPETKSITIQAGVTYRTRIKFDVSILPDLAGIHRSQLELYLDEEKSQFGSEPQDSVLMLRMYSKIDSLDSTTEPIIEWTGNRAGGTNKFIFKSISSAVETWNRSDKTGELVLMPITGNEERLQLDRLHFYGNDADPAVRPTLKIIYSYIE